jgi:phage gp37-like protein
MSEPQLTYAAIEDHILAALQPLREELGVRTLASYGGDFSADSIQDYAVLYPAVLVQAAELILSGESNRSDVMEVTITIYAADRNTRGAAAARAGDETLQSPGVYALLEGVRAFLHRYNIPRAGVGPVRLKREMVLAHRRRNALCVGLGVYTLRTRGMF